MDVLRRCFTTCVLIRKPVRYMRAPRILVRLIVQSRARGSDESGTRL
jgi:hypothetical protein